VNSYYKIHQLIAQHDSWRSQTINLIASENKLSPLVRAALQSDLVQRYGDYTGRDLSARRYRGNRYIELLERETVQLARAVFKTAYVELRPLSGHVAGAAVLMGLCKPGDLVLEVGREGGGHREAGKLAVSSLADLKVEYLPFDAATYNIDVQATLQLIEQKRPRIVILGSSNFLFPHPVAELARFLKQFPETLLVYDASHVLGLMAGGCFQDPLREGAEVVFGSTHKTFPGPQGGILFTNRADLIEKISEAAYPGLVTNHHLFRIPALALTLLEMKEWGKAYAEQIIQNAQALGIALEMEGVPCVKVEGRFSQSHTILVCVRHFGSGMAMAERLEEAGIITTAAHLPEYWGGEGIRIGVQEITRLGAKEEEMIQVAHWISQVLNGAQIPAEISIQTASFAKNLGPVRFTWEQIDE